MPVSQTTPAAPQHLTDMHLQVLVFMSLIGEGTEHDVAHVSDVAAEDCEAEFLDLAATGLAKWGGGSAGWRITDLGRTEHAERVQAELAELGLGAFVRQAYDAVLAADDDRDAVLSATAALVARMRRFGAYARRLAAASEAGPEGCTGDGAGDGAEDWHEVRDMLVRDLAITLGLPTD